MYPEIEEFLKIEDQLNQFKKKHAKVIDQLNALIDDYNAAVVKARDRVKKEGKSIGPFKFYKATKISWDVGILKNLLSEQQFSEVTTVVVDNDKMKLAIKSGKVPKDTVELAKIEQQEPRCKGPNKIGGL